MRKWLVICLLATPAGCMPVPAMANDLCNAIWDMSLVARALAEENLSQETIVRVLGRIYDAPTGLSSNLTKMALADHRSALLFADHMRQLCKAQHKPARAAPLLL
jgi:hypothetical protein